MDEDLLKEDLMIFDLLLHWEEYNLPELTKDEELDIWIKFLERISSES